MFECHAYFYIVAGNSFFERNYAIHPLVHRFINRAHAAVPKFTHDAIAILENGVRCKHEDNRAEPIEV